MNILSVVGARPQFVKLVAVDAQINKFGHHHTIVHTGQHYDYEMSKSFFEQLSIPEPDIDLEVGSGTHAYQTGMMLARIGQVLEEETPDIVLTYGDTNSTLAASQAAVKLRIPTAHVESGFRSFDITMPEEINRVISDRISQILFAPTRNAVKNLKMEGIDDRSIVFAGNIMAETLLNNLEKTKDSSILKKLELSPENYGVLTCHRQENTLNPKRLERIFKGLSESPIEIIFPMHPRIKNLLNIPEITGALEKAPIRIIEPLPYLDFIKLEKESTFLITDSGGVQEEGLILQKPCITLRYNTEHIETLDSGGNVLVGAETKLIREEIEKAYKLHKKGAEFPIPEKWDGFVSKRIVEAVEAKLEYAKDLLRFKEDFSK